MKPKQSPDRARARVTVCIRDAGGGSVGKASGRRGGSDEAALSFDTAPLATGVYEVSLRIVVARRDDMLSEHTHRVTFSVP